MLHPILKRYITIRMKDWLKQSNRYKHLIGGFLVGFAPINVWAGLYASFIASLCLEFKDKEYGGKWDWVDSAVTMLGGCIGAITCNVLLHILL